MAFTSLRTQDQDAYSAAGGTFLLLPATAAVELNDLIVLAWNVNVASVTVTSINDNSSQSGSANVYTVNTTRSTTAHSFGTAYCRATRRLLTTDTITITLSNATGTRRASTLAVFVPANGNPVLDKLVGVTADTTSPVTYATSGTLAAAESLVMPFGAWRGGAVGSGWVGFGSTGYANLTGSLSAGSTSRHEINGRYNLNVGSTSAIVVEETYTSITNAHGELMTFTDIPLRARNRILVRRTRSGA